MQERDSGLCTCLSSQQHQVSRSTSSKAMQDLQYLPLSYAGARPEPLHWPHQSAAPFSMRNKAMQGLQYLPEMQLAEGQCTALPIPSLCPFPLRLPKKDIACKTTWLVDAMIWLSNSAQADCHHDASGSECQRECEMAKWPMALCLLSCQMNASYH